MLLNVTLMRHEQVLLEPGLEGSQRLLAADLEGEGWGGSSPFVPYLKIAIT